MKTQVINRIIIAAVLMLMSFCFITETTYSEVTISEIMYGSEIRFSPKQWIEISNTGTKPINLTGWTLTVQNVDSDDLLGPVTATINFRDATFEDAPRIWPNDFLLIVTSATDDNSGGFMEDQVYDLRWREDLGISFNTTWLSAEGFRIILRDKDGNLIDEAGNYDGNTTLWDLPYYFNRGRIRAGNRTSLIRRYANGVALDGTQKESWISAADANLTADQKTYYGDENDISSPGIGIVAIGTGEISPPQVVVGQEGAGEISPPQVDTQEPEPVAKQPEAPEEDSEPDYIQGPWLWMIAKGSDIDADYLAAESDGAITEDQVARNGVNEGDNLGKLQWTPGSIYPTTHCGFFLCASNNVNAVINATGLSAVSNINNHSAYALINIISPSDQSSVLMGVGSDDAIKVWLNGTVVHRNKTVRRTTSIQDQFRVNLKAGDNFLLLKVSEGSGNWGMFFKIYLDAEYFTASIPIVGTDSQQTVTPETPTTTSTLSISPASMVSPAVGEQLELTLNIEGGEAVAGYQATVRFDETVLRFVSGANGNFLPAGAFFVEPKVEGNLVRLNAASLTGETNGDGTLATLTFEVIAVKASALMLSDVLLSNREGITYVPSVENAQITELLQLRGDVNGDGTVNIQDLVLVASNINQTGENSADVNEDSVVNIQDLVLVAGALGNAAAAPSLPPQSLEMLTSKEIKLWLSQAQQLDLTDARLQRGILFLEQLLVTLTPKDTALLANYPNPFNPETWIPYQLAKEADVTLHIYAVNGQLVRTLTLGHQPAGMYQNRSRAAYWDGRNALGEPVASDVYFYTLTAGDFTATRKMLIRK